MEWNILFKLCILECRNSVSCSLYSSIKCFLIAFLCLEISNRCFESCECTLKGINSTLGIIPFLFTYNGTIKKIVDFCYFL